MLHAWRSRLPPWAQFLLRWSWNLFLLIVPLGVTVFGLILMKLSLELPDVAGLSTYEQAQTTKVLSRDGQLVATLFVEKRTPVDLGKISPLFLKALLAVEDSRFYAHHGVDFWGVGRAFVANAVLRRVDQGASTLTMQLARHRFLSQDVSYTRKLREMMLAMRIEKNFSKQKILEFYVNNVYFGSGAYGIASASHLYFGCAPDRLSLPQAALLAGLVQAPSQLTPLLHPQEALDRMKVVLVRMRETGYISDAERKRAEAEKLHFGGNPKSVEPMLKYPYFTTFVIAQLAEDMPEEQLYRGGLEVNTTLDVSLQRWAEAEVSEVMAERGRGVNAGSAALVLIENSTGAVRAMVGGRGWSKSNQFNRAWQALRQPGSSFKPIVYALALRDGMTPDSLVDDSPVTFGDWTPKNSDGRYLGRIRLRTALEQSRNVVAARLCKRVGPVRVVELAHSLGITEELSPNLSIALGSCEVSPLSMASAFSSIASGGFYRRPLSITRVTSSAGEVMLDNRNSLVLPVMPVDVCSQLVDMMIGVVQSGTGRGAQLAGVQVAGKTGTTDESRDAWFVGFTPDYTLAVWVGNDDHSPMWQVYGGGLPAVIWRGLMQRIPARQTHFAFLTAVPKPAPVVSASPKESAGEVVAPEPEEVVDEEPLPPIEPWEPPSPSPEEPGEATASPPATPDLVVPTPVSVELPQRSKL